MTKKSKSGLSDAQIVKLINSVIRAIKTGTVKTIVKLTVLLVLAGCGSDPQPRVVHEQAGSPPVVDAATTQSDASEGGEGGVMDNHTVESAGQGGVPSIAEDAGSPQEGGAGGEAGSIPVDVKCPQGHWAICDGPGADGGPINVGFACQMDLGYGQHYQFPCNPYCDLDDTPGGVDPDQQTRCEAAGGTCTCLGIDLDGGPCPNRYECKGAK